VPEGVTRAGDRAPDAPLVDPSGLQCRLFDLYRGPHFTLLALGGAELPAFDARFAKSVKAYRIVRAGQGGDALVDTDGHVHRNYGDGLILVRPDGYLGYAAPHANSLNAYLARFFG
jgi:hypothetical protein